MDPQPPTETYELEHIPNTQSFNAMSRKGEFLAVLHRPTSRSVPVILDDGYYWVDNQGVTTEKEVVTAYENPTKSKEIS